MPCSMCMTEPWLSLRTSTTNLPYLRLKVDMRTTARPTTQLRLCRISIPSMFDACTRPIKVLVSGFGNLYVKVGLENKWGGIVQLWSFTGMGFG